MVVIQCKKSLTSAPTLLEPALNNNPQSGYNTVSKPLLAIIDSFFNPQPNTNMNLIKLREYTSQWFRDANVRYGLEPYDVHLDEVRAVLRRFGLGENDRITPFIPQSYEYLHIAAELHDVFEDTQISPGYVIALGVNVSAIAIALLVTDEKGETRRKRKAKTYENIRFCNHAIILKLADRIANVERGEKNDMYRKEHEAFHYGLYIVPTGEMPTQEAKIEAMWKHLNELLELTPA